MVMSVRLARALKATGPDLVNRLTVDGGGDGVRTLAASWIGLQGIGILILRLIIDQRGAEEHAVLGEIIGVVGVDLHFFQAGAALEDVADDLVGAGGDLARRQVGAVLKGADADDEVVVVPVRVGEDDLFQVGAA